jgi:hypothetical protein
MTQSLSTDPNLPILFEGFEAMETLFQNSELAPAQDLSLCFVCLRWTAGSPECRPGHRCEVRLAMEAPTYQGRPALA